MFDFMCRFQKWFLSFFLLTFKVNVKGHGFRMHGADDYVMICCRYSVNRRSKPGYIGSRYLTAILMKHSNDLDLPTQKVKVI